MDGDLEVSVTDAIDTRFDILRRYRRKDKLTPEDIAEITNPNLIAKDDASEAFRDVQETTIPKIMINMCTVTNMAYMFYGCKNLLTLDLSNFDTSNVTKMNYMFYSCPKLEILDISNFNTEKTTTMSYMFRDLPNFRYIIINNPSVVFNMAKTGLQNKSDCKILVPKDSLNDYKNSSYFSKHASQLDAIENYNIIKPGNGK